MRDTYRHVIIYCGRCDQHHVARAFEHEDETEWVVQGDSCQASFAAPVTGAAARDPLVLDAVTRRLEAALAAAPMPRAFVVS